MINILTLKFGTKYGPEYVNRLYAGISRNTTCDFNFICYTDDASGLIEEITVREAARPIKTHWDKLEFHRRGFVKEGSKCLILDIDWVVTQNIDDILNYDIQSGEFVSINRWWSYRKNICPLNGGFQMFHNGDTDHLWHTFDMRREHWMAKYHHRGDVIIPGMGEQNFIYEHLNMPLRYLPSQWFGKYASDKNMQRSVELLWRDSVDPYDPYFIDDQLSPQVKMVHFTSDFNCYINDNSIASHKWIEEHWCD